MSTPQRSVIEPLAGFRSQEVASFIAQMDDQSRRLSEDTRDLTRDELEWQPKIGMNTIGMLLSHMAIVEVWWTMIVLKRDERPSVDPILGISVDDDGMPLPESAKPPDKLAGKDMVFYDDLLKRARAYLKESAADENDLDREMVRTREDGSKRAINVRWYFYHILEHFSGHYGQVLLLRHLYKTARVPARA